MQLYDFLVTSITSAMGKELEISVPERPTKTPDDLMNTELIHLAAVAKHRLAEVSNPHWTHRKLELLKAVRRQRQRQRRQRHGRLHFGWLVEILMDMNVSQHLANVYNLMMSRKMMQMSPLWSPFARVSRTPAKPERRKPKSIMKFFHGIERQEIRLILDKMYREPPKRVQFHVHEEVVPSSLSRSVADFRLNEKEQLELAHTRPDLVSNERVYQLMICELREPSSDTQIQSRR